MASRSPSSTSKTRHYQEADTLRKARFFHAIDQARDSSYGEVRSLSRLLYVDFCHPLMVLILVCAHKHTIFRYRQLQSILVYSFYLLT